MKNFPIISINGKFTDQVSVLDRGFAYGDGAFETCKLVNGKIIRWNLHRDRLLLACEKLKIAINLADLEAKIHTFVAQIPTELLSSAIFKVTVTRGQGGRGYAISPEMQPTYVLALFSAPQYPIENFTQGVSVKICNQRLSCNASLAGLKHLNRLENILARAEWNDPSIAEGLILDTQKNLIEATASNLFLVRNKVLMTPKLNLSGVAGVMRRFVIESLVPKLGLNVEITDLKLEDLQFVDEIFLCNSAFGIWPVRKIEAPINKIYPVGIITQQLQNALTESEAAYV